MGGGSRLIGRAAVDGADCVLKRKKKRRRRKGGKEEVMGNF